MFTLHLKYLHDTCKALDMQGLATSQPSGPHDVKRVASEIWFSKSAIVASARRQSLVAPCKAQYGEARRSNGIAHARGNRRCHHGLQRGPVGEEPGC